MNVRLIDLIVQSWSNISNEILVFESGGGIYSLFLLSRRVLGCFSIRFGRRIFKER